MPELRTNPTIEDEITNLLDGETKEAALGFLAYLKKNGLTPQRWFGPGFWRIPYQSFYLCGMHLKKDSWHLWFWSGDYIGRHDAEFVKTVQRYVKPCIKCTSDCQFGKDMTVFGNEFSYTCIQFPVQIVNPDFDALECVKALLEYWKTAQPNDFSWHYSG